MLCFNKCKNSKAVEDNTKDIQERIFNLLEKIYTEVQDTKRELKVTKLELKQAISKVELKLENEVIDKIGALFDHRDIVNN